MTRYRHHLPQLAGGTFLTDGGMETTLIFHDGIDLPHFAAFILLDTAEGRQALDAYYRRYLNLARAQGTGFILDSATWRANPDWGEKLGYDAVRLADANRRSIDMLAAIREDFDRPGAAHVISGAIGPRGDGYKAGRMNAAEAEDYHSAQIAAFASTEADMVSGFTITNVEEAVGIARAAAARAMPVVISFTVETDGRLITGPTIAEAIEQTDEATLAAPAYYMINCAHPTHFADQLARSGRWRARIGGLRANASTKSHAELDESPTLDPGDPHDLGERYRQLMRLLPSLRVMGGCCGTDHRHLAAICEACLPARAA
ncbi:homocysteine S-methyltransferase family protein [Pararhizobium haloflavum]|uniref:homocysteine S-methyltransferase family protein n=1 Tax=Pararhizobium haloflavum TaxID=2037914 RepID=UPI000C1868ED|nr:homocysteine S-methyltransferase family protein [Pararhizobium haloflavum]